MFGALIHIVSKCSRQCLHLTVAAMEVRTLQLMRMLVDHHFHAADLMRVFHAKAAGDKT